MAKINFLQHRFSITVPDGSDLLNIPLIKFGCRQGNCGSCAIKVVKGAEHLTKKSKMEQSTLSRLGKEGHRLACQCALNGDIDIEQSD